MLVNFQTADFWPDDGSQYVSDVNQEFAKISRVLQIFSNGSSPQRKGIIDCQSNPLLTLFPFAAAEEWTNGTCTFIPTSCFYYQFFHNKKLPLKVTM